MRSRQFAVAALLGSALAADNCRCLPGDDCWPTPSDWQQLNETVDGRLVATTPLAAPCHDPEYDDATCESLRENWQWPQGHYESSSSVMAPFFANRSCDPFTSQDTPCEFGNYVRYAINVSTSDHVAAGIKFATEKNIRLVVRNTGHDYNGKSTGAGALAIWTHHLKSLSLITNYTSPTYTGPAIRIGAGVQGGEAYALASSAGLAVVGGECPTVGIAGGYSQGGGHSALSSRYGLGADQVLEWEVVDGTGVVRRASREENADLYWALSGGGAGSWGVVVGMVSKAHEDVVVSGANLTFSLDGGVPGGDKEVFWKAIAAWQLELPRFVDKGAMVIWSFTESWFGITPITAPGVTGEELVELLRPFKEKLAGWNITYDSYVNQFDGYYEQFTTMQSPIQVGIAQYGGWLLPRSVVQAKNDEIVAAYRNIVEDGATFINVALNVSKEVTGDVYNSVLPAWRDALVDTVVTTPWNFTAPWEEMIEWQDKMTNKYIPQLTALAPESGCYANEGDFRQPNWQKYFYGSNYAKLREIKKKYDPLDLFYGVAAVGSEEWNVAEDGRMCRTSNSSTKIFSRATAQNVLPEL
ncbi:putative fad fmn-containing isoamyl alcohol oxidase protein [Lasiodiplodia theobromae]|uniref:Fad fmn-containing isoamyl alcohol oxidase protein n=1 Tax=Lasiodiplodia theobromae TaxID=45133 RepID=A0A8H7IQY7_9PEZI|nr:putative fad fmn-containing isoamyl alcohol oxidase protein [Lasiodiplodia theobromae]